MWGPFVGPDRRPSPAPQARAVTGMRRYMAITLAGPRPSFSGTAASSLPGLGDSGLMEEAPISLRAHAPSGLSSRAGAAGGGGGARRAATSPGGIALRAARRRDAWLPALARCAAAPLDPRWEDGRARLRRVAAQPTRGKWVSNNTAEARGWLRGAGTA